MDNHLIYEEEEELYESGKEGIELMAAEYKPHFTDI